MLFHSEFILRKNYLKGKSYDALILKRKTEIDILIFLSNLFSTSPKNSVQYLSRVVLQLNICLQLNLLVNSCLVKICYFEFIHSAARL